MEKQTLEQLLAKAEKEVINYGNKMGQAFSLKLEVSLAHDYCWQATAVMHKGDFETGETIKIESYGQTPEEALNKLIGELSNINNLWKEICEASPNYDSGCPEIALPILRKLLEKYNILADEKNGM